ncbi:MAG: OmpA family protein, partial [Alphaproteobacteria bacterium]|nr:OmpA family protein [Alphaproteobacteria bacterium]
PAPPPGAASIYQPPSVAPTPAPSMASVAQAQFQPPPPPTIPGRPPLAQIQAATGAAQAAQPVPPPAAPSYTPPGAPAVAAPPAPAYPPQQQQPQPLQPQQQQQQQQIAALPPSMQRPVLTPPPGYGLPPSANALAAAPTQPPLPAPSYPYATVNTGAGAVLNPIRPPPPPISPALPQLASRGGSAVDEARQRAAAGANDAAAISEARRRAAFASGQQVALILFADGSASLGAADRDLLQRVAAMAQQTGAVVRVVGHASGGAGDSRGANRSGNFAISQARADAAAAALASAGLPADRVVVEARGDSEPVYRETTPAGAAGNRRVDVFLQ